MYASKEVEWLVTLGVKGKIITNKTNFKIKRFTGKKSGEIPQKK